MDALERQPLAGSPSSSSNPDVQSLQGKTRRDLEPLHMMGVPNGTSHTGGGRVDAMNKQWKATAKWARVITLASLVCTAISTLFLIAAFMIPTATVDVNFFVIGDWGREGSLNQTLVADLMAKTAPGFRPEFIISTGDNFYLNGLNSTQDPLFDRSFRNVYHHPGLQLPWHAVLGNHDYGDGGLFCENDTSIPCDRSPLHQLGLGLTSRDSRWHCERFYTETVANGAVQLFFIDTTPMNLSLYTMPGVEWVNYKGGIRNQSWEAQLKEFEYRLAVSKAEWKLVVGHHPPRSYGHHGSNEFMMEYVEPLLAKYKVQAAFFGHDHNLQHLHLPDLQLNYFISGGGSDCDEPEPEDNFRPLSRFHHMYSGFAAASIKGNWMNVDFYGVGHGERPMYSAVLHKRG